MIVLQRVTIRHWQLLAVLFILLVWVASLSPTVNFRGLHFPQSDKVFHFLSYGVIGYLLCRGWPRWPLWLAWLLAIVSGGAVEIAQALLTTTRHPEWLDMLANASGALTGVVIARLTQRPGPDDGA